MRPTRRARTIPKPSKPVASSRNVDGSGVIVDTPVLQVPGSLERNPKSPAKLEVVSEKSAPGMKLKGLSQLVCICTSHESAHTPANHVTMLPEALVDTKMERDEAPIVCSSTVRPLPSVNSNDVMVAVMSVNGKLSKALPVSVVSNVIARAYGPPVQ